MLSYTMSMLSVKPRFSETLWVNALGSLIGQIKRKGKFMGTYKQRFKGYIKLNRNSWERLNCTV